MRIPWKTSTPFSTRLYVTSAAGTAVTGLVDGAFTKQLTASDVHSVVAVTVTEIDAVNQSGHYKAVFTPNAAGYWFLRVAHSTYNVRGWQAEVQVTDLGLGYSSASEILAALLAVTNAVESQTLGNTLKYLAAVTAGKGSGTVADPWCGIGTSTARVAVTMDGADRTAVTLTP